MKHLVASLLLGLFLHPFAYAAAISPEIAPRAAKLDADTKALDAARSAAIARVQEDYLKYLAEADRAASSSGKLEELPAILKARAAVTSPGADASLPTGASKALQKRHAEYSAGLALVDRSFAPRYQQTNGGFLRDLAAIESRLPANAMARTEIAELKAKLVESAGSGVGQITGKWKLTYATGGSGIIEFFPNHTWKHPKDASADKKWKIEDQKLVMEFPDGGREWFILPINPKGTKGATGHGAKFNAVKQSP